jgi:molybdopterin-biosynthesis enzyme MoeA-like protein
MTLPAIAKAFGVALRRAPEIEKLIRGYHGERVTEDHLRMADVPAGSRLFANEEVPWPTVSIGNVFIFPGVPEIFRLKFPVLREHLSDGRRFYSRAVFTQCDEGEIAGLLSSVAEDNPELFIGSYPRFRGEDYKLKVTVDGADEGAVSTALEAIIAALPQDKIVRVR